MQWNAHRYMYDGNYAQDWDEDDTARRGGGASETGGGLVSLAMSLSYHLAVNGGKAIYLVVQHSPAVLAGWCTGILLGGPLGQVVGRPQGIQVMSGLAVAYLTVMAIYYLKGFTQRVRAHGHWGWMLLLATMMLLFNFVPGLMVRGMLLHAFPKLQILETITYALVPVVGTITYANYRFHKDSCPLWSAWAYRLGIRTADAVIKRL